MNEYSITYTYDKFNRVIREDYSDGSFVEYWYDAKGLLERKSVFISDNQGNSIRLNQAVPPSIDEIKRIVHREMAVIIGGGA